MGARVKSDRIQIVMIVDVVTPLELVNVIDWAPIDYTSGTRLRWSGTAQLPVEKEAFGTPHTLNLVASSAATTRGSVATPGTCARLSR